MCLTTLRHYTSRTGANNDGSDVDILGQGPNMSDWLHNLPRLWMALVVFAVTYLIAASICAGVNALAVGERARAFKAVSREYCRQWGSFSAFISHSPPLRSGAT